MPFSPISNLVGQFFNSSTSTITGTTETTIFPSGVGTRTIPGSWFQPGYNARLIVRGSVQTPLVSGATTMRLKANGTTLVSASTNSLLGNLSGAQQFAIIANIQCYTTGVNGTFGIGGEVRYPVGLAGIQVGSQALHSTNTVMNTMIDQTIDVTAQWSLASHSLQISVATLELMSM